MVRRSSKRNNHLDCDIPSHIGNANVLKSAQMGHVGLVCQVGSDDVQGQAGLPLDYHIGTGRCSQEEIGRRGRFRPSSCIEVVLGHIPVQIQRQESVVQEASAMGELILDFREQAGRWYQWQVIAAFLSGVHAGEGAA